MIKMDQKDCLFWIQSLLQSDGVPETHAQIAADIFLRASLRNTGHHDITYLPQRLQLLKSKKINPEGEMECLLDTPVFSRFDGQGALGEYCCGKLLHHTMDKALQNGLAMGTVRHSNHFLAGHPYGQIAAEKNCMALVWSNTDPCMGDPDSRAKVIGNNPLGFGAPGTDHPLVLDLCMAYASLGKLGERIKEDREIPDYWGKDEKGDPSSNPDRVLNGGVCSPMGMHKGFGMALMHEMLTSGLSGGEMGPQVVPQGGWQTHSQTILVISLEKIGSAESWNNRMEELRSDISGKLQGENIRFPGDHLYEILNQNGKNLHIPESCFKELQAISIERGIQTPQPQ